MQRNQDCKSVGGGPSKANRPFFSPYSHIKPEVITLTMMQPNQYSKKCAAQPRPTGLFFLSLLPYKTGSNNTDNYGGNNPLGAIQ